MITKWKTGGHRHLIEKVEVVRETEKQVVLLVSRLYSAPIERKEKKESTNVQYHDTWEAAHAYLMDNAQRAVESARRSLECAKGTLGNIKGLKKPVEKVGQ